MTLYFSECNMMTHFAKIFHAVLVLSVFHYESVAAADLRDDHPEVATPTQQTEIACELLEQIAGCAERPDLCMERESDKALSHLNTLPSSVVLPLVLERIQSDSRFQNGGARNRNTLYGVLVTHRGEAVPEVREQLLKGLTEPYNGVYGIVDMCAGALSITQDSRNRHTAIETLLGRLRVLVAQRCADSPEFSELRQMTEIINGLTYFGKDAEPALDDIKLLFRGEFLTLEDISIAYRRPNSTASELDRERRRMQAARFELKSVALKAIFSIEGLESILTNLNNIDPGGRVALLLFCRLRGDGAEPKDLFDDNAEHEQRIRQFVFESLESPGVEVRRAAIDALISVFGDDIIVFGSATAYHLNPQIERALQQVAANDPDKGLREIAASSLEQLRGRLDYAAQKILRERQHKDE